MNWLYKFNLSSSRKYDPYVMAFDYFLLHLRLSPHYSKFLLSILLLHCQVLFYILFHKFTYCHSNCNGKSAENPSIAFRWAVLSFIYSFSLLCILTFIQISFNHTLCSLVLLVWAFIMRLWPKTYLSLPNFSVACYRTIDNKVVFDQAQGHSVVDFVTNNLSLSGWKNF